MSVVTLTRHNAPGQAMAGVVIQAFRGHHGPVWSAALGVDGPQVLSSGEDGTLRVWNVDQVIRFSGNTGYRGQSKRGLKAGRNRKDLAVAWQD